MINNIMKECIKVRNEKENTEEESRIYNNKESSTYVNDSNKNVICSTDISRTNENSDLIITNNFFKSQKELTSKQFTKLEETNIELYHSKSSKLNNYIKEVKEERNIEEGQEEILLKTKEEDNSSDSDSALLYELFTKNLKSTECEDKFNNERFLLNQTNSDDTNEKYLDCFDLLDVFNEKKEIIEEDDFCLDTKLREINFKELKSILKSLHISKQTFNDEDLSKEVNHLIYYEKNHQLLLDNLKNLSHDDHLRIITLFTKYPKKTLKKKKCCNLFLQYYNQSDKYYGDVLIKEVNLFELSHAPNFKFALSTILSNLKNLNHREIIFKTIDKPWIWTKLITNKLGARVLESLVELLIDKDLYHRIYNNTSFFKTIEENIVSFSTNSTATHVIQLIIKRINDSKMISIISENIIEIAENRNGFFVLTTAIENNYSNNKHQKEKEKLVMKILDHSEILCMKTYASTMIENIFQEYNTWAIDYFIEKKKSYIFDIIQDYSGNYTIQKLLSYTSQNPSLIGCHCQLIKIIDRCINSIERFNIRIKWAELIEGYKEENPDFILIARDHKISNKEKKKNVKKEEKKAEKKESKIKGQKKRSKLSSLDCIEDKFSIEKKKAKTKPSLKTKNEGNKTEISRNENNEENISNLDLTINFNPYILSNPHPNPQNTFFLYNDDQRKTNNFMFPQQNLGPSQVLNPLNYFNGQHRFLNSQLNQFISNMGMNPFFNNNLNPLQNSQYMTNNQIVYSNQNIYQNFYFQNNGSK